MNILLIGTEKSIHDLKWASYLAAHSPHRFFFISERPNKADEEYKEKYLAAGVTLLEPLPPFSISSLKSSYHGFKHLHRLIKENNIQLVHVIFPTPHLYWMLFSKLPILVSTRGSDVLVVIKSLIEGRGIRERWLFYLMKKALRKVAAITCTSELQAVFLEKHFDFLKNKISIARTGIDLHFIEKTVPETHKRQDKKIIFSPRFFSPIYNTIGQIEAIKQLSNDEQKQLFVRLVKGKTEDKAYEKQVMDALSKAQFEYEVIPYLSQKEMIETYKNADLVLMAPFSDGTPNSALEAMACKKPLIISDLPYQSPLFENTCLKVNPHDVADISNNIHTALTNYPEAFINQGFIAVKTYGNQAVEMQKIIDLYQKIAADT